MLAAAVLMFFLSGSPAPVRAAQCQDGFVIWANGQTGSMTIDSAGSGIRVNGNVHSNRDIRIAGSNNVLDGDVRAIASIDIAGQNNFLAHDTSTVTGTVEFGTTFTDGGGPSNTYPTPVPLPTPVLADKVPPLSFNIADYQPGGASAVAAGSNYHPVTGDLTVTATEAALGGLWYATGNIFFPGGSLTSTITLVAEGTIDVHGSSLNFTHFSDNLLLFANTTDKTSDAVLKIAGSGSSHTGTVFALGGGIELSGATNTFTGMVIGQRVTLNGSNLVFNFDGGFCATPTPAPTNTPTLTPTPTDTSTPTITPTPTNTSTPTPTPLPTIDLVAGSPGEPGYSGDGGPAGEALLNDPHGVYNTHTTDSIYFADTGNNAIRKVTGDGTMSTVVGTGVATGSIDGEGGDPSDDLGDGGPATSATLFAPRDVFVDGDGAIYIADTENCRIRKVVEGVISTVVGDGVCGFSGDNGPATAAQLDSPSGVAVGSAGAFYIADTDNCRVRKVIFAEITTAVGIGECGFGGDGGIAVKALLNHPRDVYFFTSNTDLLIADTDNHRIRRFDTLVRDITTFAGLGTVGYSGDGGPAVGAELNAPEAIAATPNRVFIADTQNNAIRAVDAATNVITTIVGDGAPGSVGDGGPSVDAQLSVPAGVAIGSVDLSDTGNNTLRVSGDVGGGPPGRSRFRTTTACAVGSVSSIDWALPVLLLGLILGRKQIDTLFVRLRGPALPARFRRD